MNETSFECFPTRLLGALSGMPAVQQLVYVTVLFRIYEAQKPCPDTVEALARRTGYTKSKVQAALEALSESGRLVKKENGWHNPRAEMQLANTKNDSSGVVFQAPEIPQRNQQMRLLGNTPYESDSESLSSSQRESNRISESSKQRRRALNQAGIIETLFPTGWVLGDKGVAYALERGFGRERVEEMFEAFRNHHLALGTARSDWLAAWRGWVCTQLDISKRNRGSANGHNKGGSVVDAFDKIQRHYEERADSEAGENPVRSLSQRSV